nr:unnamed protein product [Callosobruchus chinensis]
MKYLRKVKGVTRIYRIRNEAVRQELEALIDHIESKQLRLWGHLQRMAENIPIKQIWEAKVLGKRKRGRPQKTWEDTIGSILKKRGTDPREA